MFSPPVPRKTSGVAQAVTETLGDPRFELVRFGSEI